MNMTEEEIKQKIENIKKWLGTGSINIFGLPMSGKDTIGMKLAEELSAKFLSSGIIIREVEAEQNMHMTDQGQLIPQDKFKEIVLPYFEREDLADSALVLSSVGRWEGEEGPVMEAAKKGGHPIKAVIKLKLTEEAVRERWAAAKTLDDRGARNDDNDPKVFETRIREFNEKTMPVLKHYEELGLIAPVQADLERNAVFEVAVTALAEFASNS